MAALNASTDPVARIVLVAAMPWREVLRPQAILERLRSDPVPGIRLLATIAVFSKDDPATWPALDAAIRADLEACVGVLDAPGSGLSETAGQRWARALTGLDREEDCCACRSAEGRAFRGTVGGAASVGGVVDRVPAGRRRSRGSADDPEIAGREQIAGCRKDVESGLAAPS